MTRQRRNGLILIGLATAGVLTGQDWAWVVLLLGVLLCL